MLFELRQILVRCVTTTAIGAFLLSLSSDATPDLRSVVRLPASTTEQLIQQALDDLPTGGEVILEEGTYEISRPIFLRHDFQTLRGSGGRTVLHLGAGADCPVVVMGPEMNEILHPATQLHLADLAIDGNRMAQHGEYWRSAGDGSMFNNNGIQVWNVVDSSISQVSCRNCRSGGLVTANVRRLDVEGFESSQNRYDGLACYETSDSHFNGLKLHDNIAAGISIDLSFNHNSISNAVLSGNDLGIFMRCSFDNRFEALEISKSRHDGIFMAQTAVPTSHGWLLTPHTECQRNIFEGLVVSDCGGAAFHINDASCTGNTIAGAHFLRNAKAGLVQPASKPASLLEFATR